MIDSIYAYLADEPDGSEGIVGALIGDRWMSLTVSDEELAKKLMPIAQEIVKTTGQKIKLVKFEQRVEIQEING